MILLFGISIIIPVHPELVEGCAHRTDYIKKERIILYMPPEQTPPPQPEPFNFLETDPKKNFGPWSIKLILVLIIVFLGIAGYFKYQAYQSYQYGLDAIEKSQQQQPRDDSFTGWQTYRNKEYGFEVKHPQNWEVSTDFPNLVSGEFIVSFRDNKYKSALDWTGLILQSYPYKNTNYTETQLFNPKDVESLIKYKIGSRYIYGSCTSYDDDITSECSQILSTFKFIE